MDTVLKRESLPGHPADLKDIKDGFELRPEHARAAKNIGLEHLAGFFGCAHCVI